MNLMLSNAQIRSDRASADAPPAQMLREAAELAARLSAGEGESPRPSAGRGLPVEAPCASPQMPQALREAAERAAKLAAG